MFSRFSKNLRNPFLILLLLFLFSLPAYGWLLLHPGLFGDDPQLLYAFHRYGLAGYADALGWSRPFGVWVYALLVPLIGEHLLLWQLSAILLRTLSAWLLYLLLHKVDEKWQMPAMFAAFACLLYPGFTQQAHALQFILHWAALSACLASQWLMLHTLETKEGKNSLLFSLLSILLAGLGIFSTEYFVGVELLRPFLLWRYPGKKNGNKQPLGLVVKRWLPYLSLLLVFLVWRLFLADISYPRPLLLEELVLDAKGSLDYLFARIPADLWQSGALAWAPIFDFSTGIIIDWAQAGLGLLLAILFCILFWGSTNQESDRRIQKSIELLGLGLLAMLAGGLPLWVSKTPLVISFPENRATLALMVGICLLLVGLLRLLPARLGLAAVSTLIGFSVAFQFNVSLDYTHAWDQLRGFFWQLTRCAPGLEPGTFILYEDLPIRYYPANSYAALLNWSYAPEANDGVKAYDVFQISERLGNALPALEADIPVQHGDFRGSTSQALVITLDENGCLRFLQMGDETLVGLPPILQQASLISNPGVIISDPQNPARLPAFLVNGLSGESQTCSCKPE